MFIVEREEYTNKTLRMPKKLIRRLEELAKEKNISMNKLVVLCCDYALDNMQRGENNTENE